MPAKVREASLNTRTARLKLAPRAKPYYRRLDADLHLGYYRPATKGLAGSWIARRYLGEQRYETHTLGVADDLPDVPVDGKLVLAFDQAQRAAMHWKRHLMAAKRAADAGATTLTVRAALETYIAARKRKDPRAGRDAELRLTHHVLGAPIADRALLDLSDRDLSGWRSALRRGGRGGEANRQPLAPATIARLLNDFRAALTAAARRHKAPADLMTTISEGLRAPQQPDRARPKQVLTDSDVRKLVDAAYVQDADFGALVMVLAATGARMGQIARLTVADLQVEAGRVMVPASRKGRGVKQITQIAVPLPADVVVRLRPLVAGRAGHDALLLRWCHRQVPGSAFGGTAPRWERVDRKPWSDAAEMTRPWKATVKAAGLPASLVPYCLRHSSIVRGLRAGLPVRLVAAVHDTSGAMVEKHYAAFIVDAVEDLLRRAVVPLSTADVTPLCAMGT